MTDPMTTAVNRLNRAIDRLETAIAARDASEAGERVRLSQALESAEEREREAVQHAHAVSERLDAAITRLSRMLEDEVDGAR